MYISVAAVCLRFHKDKLGLAIDIIEPKTLLVCSEYTLNRFREFFFLDILKKVLFYITHSSKEKGDSVRQRKQGRGKLRRGKEVEFVPGRRRLVKKYIDLRIMES